MSQLVAFNASEERIQTELAQVRPLLDMLAFPDKLSPSWAEATRKLLRKHVTPLRTELDRVRKNINRANEAIVNAEHKRLADQVVAVEQPLATKCLEIEAEERRVAAAVAEQRRKEQEAKDAELERLRKLEADLLAKAEHPKEVIVQTMDAAKEKRAEADALLAPLFNPPKAAVTAEQRRLEFGLKLRTFATNHFPLEDVATDRKTAEAKRVLGEYIKTLTGEAK